MNPITILAVGVAYGYLAGNPKARHATIKQLQKLSGMAIDGINKQGDSDVQEIPTEEQPTTE